MQSLGQPTYESIVSLIQWMDNGNVDGTEREEFYQEPMPSPAA